MKQGVRKCPRAVCTTPVRAAPSVASTSMRTTRPPGSGTNGTEIRGELTPTATSSNRADETPEPDWTERRRWSS
jgi:hypothetical protein